jgi:hypothetical protein
VKRILAKEFGSKNVSVRRGSGTAYSWIHAHVYITDEICTCPLINGLDINFECVGCKKEKLNMTVARIKANELTKDLNFPTFFGDGDYEGACFLIEIRRGDYMQRKLKRLGK